MTRLAVIDTGTNSTRLLIAETAPGLVREVMRQTNITRLGEGVDRGQRLAAAARDRVRQCVALYAASIGELGAERALILATSSVRDASDGEEFLASLAGQFAFDWRLLSGEEEASLSFLGASMSLDRQARALLFDVGGGSTEVVVGQGRQVEFATSLNLGCVRLREKFFEGDPASPVEIKAATEFIDGELKSMAGERFERIEETLAVAGTVTTLAALDLGLEVYDREQVHGHVITREKVDGLFGALSEMSLSERMQLPVMEKGRADVIAAGALIVSRLLHHIGITEFTVSEFDILDGAALAMAEHRL